MFVRTFWAMRFDSGLCAYLILYRCEVEAILILAVVYGARDIPVLFNHRAQ